jgi:broad specificity phosphatase PhoE
MAEAANRIGQHMERLAQDRNGQGIALVTHADMIRGLVALILGVSLDNLLRLEIAPASVSRIEAGPGWSRVLSLNEMTGTPA